MFILTWNFSLKARDSGLEFGPCDGAAGEVHGG